MLSRPLTFNVTNSFIESKQDIRIFTRTLSLSDYAIYNYNRDGTVNELASKEVLKKMVSPSVCDWILTLVFTQYRSLF